MSDEKEINHVSALADSNALLAEAHKCITQLEKENHKLVVVTKLMGEVLFIHESHETLEHLKTGALIVLSLSKDKRRLQTHLISGDSEDLVDSEIQSLVRDTGE